MSTTTQREFALADIDLRWVAALLVPTAIAVCAGVVALTMREPRVPAWFVVLVALTMVVGLALPCLALRRRRVTLADGVLTVTAGFNTRRTAVDALDFDRAQIFDLPAQPAARPLLQLFGTTLPGYRAGWFLLRDHRLAFVLVTNSERALLLPVTGGRPLLLTLQRPQALLDALREMTRRRRGR